MTPQNYNTTAANATHSGVNPENLSSSAMDKTPQLHGLKPGHLKEWTEGSGVPIELIIANDIRSIEGEEFEQLILGHKLAKCVDSTGTYATSEAYKLRKRNADSFTHGGWFASGVDFNPIISAAKAQSESLTGLGDREWAALLKDFPELNQSDWGCFKPDRPRNSTHKRDRNGDWYKLNKPSPIKYEHPEAVDAEAFAFNDPSRTGLWLNALAKAKQTPIILTEGAKKAAAAIAAGYIAIAVPGITQWNQPKTQKLIDQLAIFARPGREFIVAFDQVPAEKEATSAESRETKKFGIAAKKRGATVRVAKWSFEDGKGIDDLIVNQGAEAFHKAIREARTLDMWQGDSFAKALRQKNTEFYRLTADRSVQNQRYMTLALPEQGSILGVSGLMETGKSTAMGKLKDEFFAKHPDGLFDLQGYRNGLGMQTAEKWGLSHISGFECESSDVSQMLIEDANKIAYCLDSLNRRANTLLKAIKDGKVVCAMIDEGDAVLNHVLSAGTLKGRQAEIWSLWVQTLTAIIKNNGYIIIAEANLSQLAVDAFARMSGCSQVSLVENVYKPHQGRQVVDHVVLNKDGKPSDQLLGKAAHIHAVSLAKVSPVMVPSDNKNFAKRLILDAQNQGLKTLAVTGDTIEKPEVQAFLENPDKYLADFKPDLVAITTTAESGISISAGYFENVVLYGSHLEDRALCQLSGRVRGTCPLHLYIKRKGYVSSEDSAAFDALGIRKQWEQNASDSLHAAEVVKHFGQEVVQDSILATKTDGDLLHELKSVYEARKNISSFSLHYGVVSILADAGCSITQAESSGNHSQDEADAYEAAVEAIRLADATAFAEMPADQSMAWSLKILSSSKATTEQRLKARKVLLTEDYPGLSFDDLEFVKKEVVQDKLAGIKAHTFCWMMRNPGIAQVLDLHSWKAQIEQQFLILPAIRKETAKIKVLASSVLTEITELENYSENSPLVRALAQWAQDRALTLNRLFRLQIKPEHSNITTVNKLLRKIGYKSIIVKKTGSDGNRAKQWKAEAMPHQSEVWAALDSKWVHELAAESIDIEPPKSKRPQLALEENPLIQIEAVNSKAIQDNALRERKPIPIGESRGAALRYTGSDYPHLQGIALEFVSWGYGELLANVKTEDGTVIPCLPSAHLQAVAA